MEHNNPAPDVERTLLLVDGLNVVRRVYEAIPAPDSPEKAEGALKSSLSSILNQVRLHRPSHMLVAFDYGGSNWRHQISPSYREGRKPMPQPLRDALDGFYLKLWNEHGIANTSVEGYEGEDIIATVARRWLGAQHNRVARLIVTSTDKDLCQLVADGAEVYDPFGKVWRNRAWIQEKFGVPPERVGDLLALMGDSVDGISGVPGVGPKTAAKLLSEFSSLEAVLEAAPSFKGALRDKFMANLDQARLCRQLVTLADQIELGLTWNSLRAPQLPAKGAA